MLGNRWRYSWRAFAGDCFGGVAAALVAIPYGLAMASLMGLPPVFGLLTSIITSPITALFGRNRVLIGGTASATAPFIAHAVRAQGIAGAAKVCLVAAVAMMAFSMLRLGRHITRVPQAVVAGFSCGVGILMITSQDFGPVQLMVVGVACLSARMAPLLPAPLISVAAVMLGLELAGIRLPGIGVVELKWPAFAAFSWSAADVYQVAPSGVALAFMASVNVLITSRVVEHFQGRHKRLKPADADGELGAYGLANLFAGLVGAPLSVGIPARTVASVRCGATTRMANFVHGAVIVLCLWAGHGVLSRIPMAALSGVILYVGVTLLEWSTWKRLLVMRRTDAVAFLVTTACAVLVNAAVAVGAGCAIYGLKALYGRWRASSPQAAVVRAS